MPKNEKISHSGIVESAENGHIRVKILQASACSSCQAKAMCASAESKEKIIDVWNDPRSYTLGEEVTVCGSMSMGRNAVVLAFVIPLVLMVLWLVAALQLLSLSETWAVLGLLVLLGIYYAVLSAFRERLSRSFSFWIERND
jgi:sigma-E factor negative regulatory protein RseC